MKVVDPSSSVRLMKFMGMSIPLDQPRWLGVERPIWNVSRRMSTRRDSNERRALDSSRISYFGVVEAGGVVSTCA
jgi:hypothetical protein